MPYRGKGVPLVVLAGKEYGSGSSRDWAAKGRAARRARRDRRELRADPPLQPGRHGRAAAPVHRRARRHDARPDRRGDLRRRRPAGAFEGPSARGPPPARRTRSPSRPRGPAIDTPNEVDYFRTAASCTTCCASSRELVGPVPRSRPEAEVLSADRAPSAESAPPALPSWPVVGEANLAWLGRGRQGSSGPRHACASEAREGFRRDRPGGGTGRCGSLLSAVFLPAGGLSTLSVRGVNTPKG